MPLALRADLNYNRFTFKENLAFSPSGTGGTFATTDDLTQQILGGLANITIPLSMGSITPYVTTGLAGFNIKTNIGVAVPGAEDDSETKFVVSRRGWSLSQVVRSLRVHRSEAQQRLHRQETDRQ